MINVKGKGSYKWMEDGSLLLALPPSCFVGEYCWLDQDIAEAIGVDINDRKTFVLSEGNIAEVHSAITCAGGDVMLGLLPDQHESDVTRGELIVGMFICALITVAWIAVLRGLWNFIGS